MINTRGKYQIVVWAAMLSVLLLFGCDNSFSPFSQRPGNAAVIVNGFLDVNSDSQFVRVQIVRQSILSSASLDDGITVDLRNTSTATTESMIDSLFELPGGEKVHVFYSTNPVQEGTEYQLLARAKGGAIVSESTRVPSRARLILEPPTTAQLTVTQDLELRDLRAVPRELSIRYTLLRNGNGPPVTVSIPYRDAATLSTSGVDLRVRLEADRSIIFSQLGISLSDRTTVLEKVEIVYEILSQEWNFEPQNDQINFFGSAATFTESWTLADNILADLGYAVP